jgi:hypothetical protein
MGANSKPVCMCVRTGRGESVARASKSEAVDQKTRHLGLRGALQKRVEQAGPEVAWVDGTARAASDPGGSAGIDRIGLPEWPLVHAATIFVGSVLRKRSCLR